MYGSTEDASIILAFLITGALIGITAYSLYTAFVSPESRELLDPFEEHESEGGGAGF